MMSGMCFYFNCLLFNFLIMPKFGGSIHPPQNIIVNVYGKNEKVTSKRYVCGDDLCWCENHNAVCGIRDETPRYVPKLPSSIRRLRLIDVDIPIIDNTTFLNVTSLKLWRLVLFKTTTTNISSDAFQNLRFLKILEISDAQYLDPIVMSNALRGLPKTVRILYLRYHPWKQLPDAMFENLKNKSVGVIDLSDNSLQSLNGVTLFRDMNRLFKLNISGNNLIGQNVVLPNLQRLKTLDLSRNTELYSLPSFCIGESKGNSSEIEKMPNLRSLLIENIGLKKLEQGDFSCLSNVVNLKMGQNDLIYIADYTFSKLKKLRVLHLNKMTSLRSLHFFALSIPSLHTLLFNENYFYFHYAAYSSVFQFCPNLRHLNLYGNKIPDNYSTVSELIKPLYYLEKLNLGNTEISLIPNDTFSHLLRLNTLILSDNRITGWPKNTFRNLNNLQTLLIDNNYITTINNASFPFDLKYLRTLSLALNPFSCSCELMWFRNWTIRTEIDLLSFPEKYLCASPLQWKGRQIVEFNKTPEECMIPNPLLYFLIAFGILVLIFIVLILSIYHQLNTVRNCIYLIRLKLKKFTNTESTNMHQYYGFMMFCESDIDWVVRIFLPRIEESEGFSLCIEARDFSAGVVYAEEIVEKAKLSKKLIVILTNNFARDEWCQWQLELAQERIRRQGKESVLVIVLKEVNSKHMTSSLRHLLGSVPYVTWETRKMKQRLFWKVVVESLKTPLQNPPIAVL